MVQIPVESEYDPAGQPIQTEELEAPASHKLHDTTAPFGVHNELIQPENKHISRQTVKKRNYLGKGIRFHFSSLLCRSFESPPWDSYKQLDLQCSSMFQARNLNKKIQGSFLKNI